MTDDLWICKRKMHLPEYDGATGYYYYEPVEPYIAPDVDLIDPLAATPDGLVSE